MRHRGGQQRVHRRVGWDGVSSVTELRGGGGDHGGHGLVVASRAPRVSGGGTRLRRVAGHRGLVQPGAGVRLQSLAAEPSWSSAETALLKHVLLKKKT